jgi:hypothetical protein
LAQFLLHRQKTGRAVSPEQKKGAQKDLPLTQKDFSAPGAPIVMGVSIFCVSAHKKPQDRVYNPPRTLFFEHQIQGADSSGFRPLKFPCKAHSNEDHQAQRLGRDL